jgi:hypothetical protein
MVLVLLLKSDLIMYWGFPLLAVGMLIKRFSFFLLSCLESNVGRARCILSLVGCGQFLLASCVGL